MSLNIIICDLADLISIFRHGISQNLLDLCFHSHAMIRSLAIFTFQSLTKHSEVKDLLKKMKIGITTGLMILLLKFGSVGDIDLDLLTKSNYEY